MESLLRVGLPFCTILLILIFCIMTYNTTLAKNDIQINMLVIANSNDSTDIDEKIQADDFLKFFIGFTKSSRGEKTISLLIKSIEENEDFITFKYTLNSFSAKEEGDGKIYLKTKRIDFMDGAIAKFYLNSEGKIIIKTAESDSSNYFLLKEY